MWLIAIHILPYMYLKLLLVAHTTQVTLCQTLYMLMCVILLWPSKIICSLILMQNMFNVWVVEDKLIKKCVFGRSGLNTSVFEKHFISYSCILFTKYALRSFCIKLLCFSKFWFFQIFDRSSVILDQSKNSRFFKSSFCLTWLVFDQC